MPNYLYNGVELPALPDWDKETYPYAVIEHIASSGTTKLYCTQMLSWGTFYDYFKIAGPSSLGGPITKYILYTVVDGSFVLTDTADEDLFTDGDGFVYIGDLDTVIWANKDIRDYTSDGSIVTILAASDPIPVTTVEEKKDFDIRTWLIGYIMGLTGKPLLIGVTMYHG